MHQETLFGALDAIVRRRPDHTAIVFDGRRYAYRELQARAERAAYTLRALGLGSGDRVAFLGPNRPEYLELLFGASRIGAALVPLNSRYGADDLTDALRRSRARVLVFAERFRRHDYVALVEGALGGVEAGPERRSPTQPDLERIVCLDDVPGLGLPTYGDLLRRAGEAPGQTLPASASPESAGLLLFTSGSSGVPKPVVLTQGQIVRNMARVRDRQGVGAEDRVLSFLPYFHVFGGVISTLVPVLGGGTIIMLPAFDADQSLDLAERERCTVLYSVAPCYRAWFEHPHFGRYDLSSIRTGVCSAGLPAMTATAKRVREILAPMHSLFGMTETAGVATMTLAGDAEAFATETAGRPLPGAEVAIFEPGTGRRLGPGDEGEIRVRGDMVTTGYFCLPDETTRALDADGWLHTGDRGVLTPEGYLLVAGRMDERLRCGGENVDPREVERFLEGHPCVAQCQVIGVPDPRLLEIPVAFIIARVHDHPHTETSILEHCRGRIADFKVPRRVFFMEEFPGWMHKVQRFRLREIAMERMGMPVLR